MRRSDYRPRALDQGSAISSRRLSPFFIGAWYPRAGQGLKVSGQDRGKSVTGPLGWLPPGLACGGGPLAKTEVGSERRRPASLGTVGIPLGPPNLSSGMPFFLSTTAYSGPLCLLSCAASPGESNYRATTCRLTLALLRWPLTLSSSDPPFRLGPIVQGKAWTQSDVRQG
uniref:Uncharacterized protein n=1 Tax=Ananas comosus var. bracteatus TaxID=296719 RepID=A0A6V7PH57_ANACO|nr:unnamed protein product [Ananas comosus var. bracteatus]